MEFENIGWCLRPEDRAYTSHSLKRDLSCLSELGFTKVELSLDSLGLIVNGKVDQCRLEELGCLLGGYDFSYSLHLPKDLNLMDDMHSDVHLDVLRSGYECARALSAGLLVYHPGRYIAEERFQCSARIQRSEFDRRSLIEYEAKQLSRLAGMYPDITLAMENLPPYIGEAGYCYAEFPTELGRQVARIDSPNVGIALDVGHLFLSACKYEFDLFKTLSSIASHVAYVNLHDNFGLSSYYHERDHQQLITYGKGDLHLPPGQGCAPIGRIMDLLKARYSGPIMLEVKGRGLDMALPWRNQSLGLLGVRRIHSAHGAALLA